MIKKAINKQHGFYGIHVMGELYGISYEKLDNLDIIVDCLTLGIELSKAKCEGMIVKKFKPKGISVVALLSESHVSIHTYPEYNSLFLDAFTCGNTCNPELIAEILKKELKATSAKIDTLVRG